MQNAHSAGEHLKKTNSGLKAKPGPGGSAAGHDWGRATIHGSAGMRTGALVGMLTVA